MNNYEQYIARKRAEYGDKFSPDSLDPKFVHYFRTGQRIKVRTSYGEELTGTVGITTGWRPAFLLIRTARSMGSSILLGRSDQIVAVKSGRTYVNA